MPIPASAPIESPWVDWATLVGVDEGLDVGEARDVDVVEGATFHPIKPTAEILVATPTADVVNVHTEFASIAVYVTVCPDESDDRHAPVARPG